MQQKRRLKVKMKSTRKIDGYWCFDKALISTAKTDLKIWLLGLKYPGPGFQATYRIKNPDKKSGQGNHA